MVAVIDECPVTARDKQDLAVRVRVLDAFPIVLVFEFVIGKEFEIEFGYVVAEVQNDRTHRRIIAQNAKKVNSAAIQANFIIENAAQLL